MAEICCMGVYVAISCSGEGNCQKVEIDNCKHEFYSFTLRKSSSCSVLSCSALSDSHTHLSEVQTFTMNDVNTKVPKYDFANC